MVGDVNIIAIDNLVSHIKNNTSKRLVINTTCDLHLQPFNTVHDLQNKLLYPMSVFKLKATSLSSLSAAFNSPLFHRLFYLRSAHFHYKHPVRACGSSYPVVLGHGGQNTRIRDRMRECGRGNT